MRENNLLPSWVTLGNQLEKTEAEVDLRGIFIDRSQVESRYNPSSKGKGGMFRESSAVVAEQSPEVACAPAQMSKGCTRPDE